MRTALAAVLLVAAQTAPLPGMYDFEWRSITTLSRYEAGDTVVSRGELTGRGRLRITRLGRDRARFEFWSPEGNGRGEIVGGALRSATFPTAMTVGHPPAPPHLMSGIVTPEGDPAHPAALELSYAEGFICRTSPAVCDNVTAWARELIGRATPLPR